MKYCPKCHVKINASRSKCPLCFSNLQGDNNITSEMHPKKQSRKELPLVYKLLITSSIVISFASIIVNLATINKTNPLYWSVLVVMAIIYGWLIVEFAIKSHWEIPTKVFVLTIFTISMVLITEIIIKQFENIALEKLWSFIYVYPAILIFVTISLFVVATVFKKLYCDSIVYLWIMIILEIIYIVLGILGIAGIPKWAYLVISGAAILVAIAMLVFHFEDTKQEFIKRLRI